MTDEIVITYETLYDVLRQERDKDMLQKLDASFYEDVQHYLTEKKCIFEGKQNTIFLEEDSHKEHQQLMNAHKIVKEIFDKRQQKIIALARDDVRIKGALIDTSNLLAEESAMYAELVALFKANRERVLEPLFAGKPKEIKREERQGTLSLRFVESITPFVGPDMQTYGPYQAGEIHELPREIAALLLKQGKAEQHVVAEEPTNTEGLQ